MVITTKHTGKNLQELRTSNKKVIIRLLRKKDLSGKELSQSLQLSPGGIQSLIDEMVDDGLLVKYNAESVVRGRRPINLKINPNIGIVVVLSLYNCSSYEIDICDFNGKVVSHFTQKTEGRELTSLLISDIERIVADSGRKLYAIAVSAIGKIQKDTGAFHYAPQMEGYVNVNFKELLEKHFKVGVVIKNKLVYLLHAERNHDIALNIQNAFYVWGLGCALCLDGRIFEGENGFAGELGMQCTDIYGALREKEYYNPYRSNHFMGAVNGLSAAVHQEIGESLDMSKIFAFYNGGDKRVRKPVEMFLQLYGLALRNLVEFMDIKQVIIGGVMAELNDKALALLAKYVNESVHDKLDVEIVRAKPECTEIKGAFGYAMDIAFEKLLG